MAIGRPETTRCDNAWHGRVRVDHLHLRLRVGGPLRGGVPRGDGQGGARGAGDRREPRGGGPGRAGGGGGAGAGHAVPAAGGPSGGGRPGGGEGKDTPLN